MSKRKSIVSSFGDFTSTPPASDDTQDQMPAQNRERPTARVGAGIIGATKRSLTELREERDQLLDTVKDGEVILHIDPELIDPSPFKDRLPDDAGDDFVQFKKLIEDEGQIVPITVRRNPADLNRYQVIYGHRRCQALKEIGRPAHAILKDHTDAELAVAQGIENASRQDLSWIEKAIFAGTMQKAGLKAKIIKSALNVDDSELSKFRTVHGTLGEGVIEAIGRAPKVGRPRWLELASNIRTKSDLKLVKKTLADAKVFSLSSNERFREALMCLMERTVKPATTDQQSKKLGTYGEVIFNQKDIRFVLEKEVAAEFSAFLGKEMDRLLADFEASRTNHKD